MMVFKRVAFIFVLLLVVAVSIFSLFRDSILLSIGDYLIVEDPVSPADVVHVIAGDDYRTDYAIQLYKQGLAKQIFFTGGWCKFHQYDHGTHGLERAISQGVPEQAVAYDDTSVTSTYDEAVLLKAYIDKSQLPVKSVMVVSDPFHMRRADWTYRRLMGKYVSVLMTPVPFEQTPFRERWWEDIRSKRYVRDEYKKFAYYIARYQLSWGPLKDWLASLDSE